jgi:oligopeptide transport system substrate-binding protein
MYRNVVLQHLLASMKPIRVLLKARCSKQRLRYGSLGCPPAKAIPDRRDPLRSAIIKSTPSNLLAKNSSAFPRRMRINFLSASTIWLSLLIGIASCGHQNKTTPGAVLHRGIGGEPSTLDPVAAADNFSFEVLRDLFEGLTTDGPNGEVVPGVAASWTVSQDGKQYSFQLRRDARWSNGNPILAQDFVNAWRRVVDPAQASPVADDLRVIAGAASIISGHSNPETLGVSAPSASVLTVYLEEPAPYLPQLLTHSAAYPSYSQNRPGNPQSKNWVSNGPYVLSEWSPGTKIELTKNPNYWDAGNVHIPRIEYQIADENSQYSRYQAGQLDMTDTVPPSAVSALKERRPKELVIAPFLATAYYGLNLSTKLLGENRDLRQALAMAIDRNKLVQSMAFGQTAAYGFVPPGTWNYSPQAWPWHNLADSDRITEARRLYAKAGYSREKPLHLRLLFNSNSVIKSTAIIIAEMWRHALGVDTELTEEEYRVFLQSRHDKSRWDIARLGWTADYNDASNFLDIFREHSTNNDVSYSNTTFDVLLDKAARASDPQSRRDLLEEDERKMLDDYPVIPLYFFVSKRLVKPYIRGIQLNPLNRVESKYLSVIAE